MYRMSKRCLIAGLLAILLTLLVSSALAATGTVTVNALVLREEMSTKSDALQTLPKGTELDVISKQGSWYKVRYGRFTGYVMTRYVKVTGSVPTGSTADDPDSLRRGDRGDAVKKMQQRLKDLGYAITTCDGSFGDQTLDAVKAFQKRNGLTQDGVAGKATLNKLYSSSAKRAAETDNSKDDADDSVTLRQGSKGTAVRTLQTRLRELGYYNHSVDGKFDSQTTEAVKAFQKRNGLTADGVAGKVTQNKLYSSSAKPAEDSKDDDDSSSLRPGATGSRVKELQQRLRDLGYYKNSIDGKYDSQTTAAVKAFQKRNGLTQDGVAGPATMNKLNSSSAKPAEDSNGSSSSGTTKLDTTKSLSIGADNEHVKALQQRLKELGYFSGTCTGYFGTATRDAVKAFQRNNHLSVDGLAGAATLSKLNSSSAKPASSGSGSSSSTSLRQGSTGAAVKALQTRLRELGYYNHSVDGKFDSQTTAAVKAFQKRNGLTQDGVAGPVTLNKLNSSSAKPAEDAKDDDKDDNNDNNKDDGWLRPGDTGTKVKELQTRLRELGYFNHSVDGKYDSQTTAAVKAFQKRNGLTQDGVAGPSTLRKLNSSSAKPAEDAKDNDKDDNDKDDGWLRPGDTGTKVKELQTRLRELGYFNHSVDGKYDSQTTTAVKAFQKRNGLTQDGVAGPSTLRKLNSSSAKPAEDAKDDDNDDGWLRPGDSGTKVKELQTRLRVLGYYKHSVDGNYGSQTTTAVKAFQKKNGLTQDGVAGPSTQSKLFSSSAKPATDNSTSGGSTGGSTGTYVTERLDWFNGGASRIPRRAIFTVKDVRTGKTFLAKRQGGQNHLDAEPLTAADTAVLKSINNFSWRRRPMLVMYNGRVYACSIYAEQHGEDTIPDNNFSGQFCLHFYGSMTHGTKVVDAAHQACEAEALKATW